MEALIESLESVIASPVVLNLLAAIAIAVWGLPRVKEFRERAEGSRWSRLLHFAKIAATETYQTYVQEIKRARADGKLTKQEINTARRDAWKNLVDSLQEEAPDLLNHYGEWAMKTAIEVAINLLKKQGGTV